MASSSNLESKATMAPEQGLAAKEPTINNEEEINPEKASDGEKARLPVGTEPDDARTENGALQKLTRAPRYFNEYVENDDEGKEDKPKRRRKRCYLCGDDSHEGKRCKKVNACFICSKKGHLVVDCPEKNVEADCASMPCLKCGNTGHDMFSCTNEYDSEDLKGIECYICKQVGHLCCVNMKSEEPREASCYNCGQFGHFGLECTKSNEVANDLQPLCRKCKEKGHSKKQCPKAKSSKKDGAATKAEKKKSRNARRRNNTNQTPNGNASQPNAMWWPPSPYHGTGNASKSQPNGVWWPPIVGPYYGRPGSNVWLSPSAAAARGNLSHQGGASPPRQHIYHHHQVGTQAVNSFDPPTGLPHQYWSPPIRTQVMENLHYPMIPTWDYQRGTQILQPHLNHQNKIQLPPTESRAPQNSLGFVNPTALSNSESPQQPLSHETEIMLPPHHHITTPI